MPNVSRIRSIRSCRVEPVTGIVPGPTSRPPLREANDTSSPAANRLLPAASVRSARFDPGAGEPVPVVGSRITSPRIRLPCVPRSPPEYRAPLKVAAVVASAMLELAEGDV